jgi:hypothetical protein
MPTEKTCPKCPNSPQMKQSQTKSILLATLKPEFNPTDSPVSKREGLPIQMWICPNCNLVELYYAPL